MESATAPPDREGRARFEQRFLAKRLPGGSGISTTRTSDPGNFVAVFAVTLAGEGNPWMTFGEAWQLCRAAAMAEYPGQTEELVRGKMRNCWSKMVSGYKLMEQRPVRKEEPK